MLPRLLLFFLFIFICFHGNAQTRIAGIGKWRTHFSYTSATSIADGGDIIYCASPNSFFSVDKTDSSYRLYSRQDGLSDISISKIEFHKSLNLLLIIYDNANIDILKDGIITNVNDISRKQLPGSKKVNNINIYGNYAFLSFDFGLIVFDCIKYEVKETVSNFTSGTDLIAVNGSTVLHDSVFIATKKGIFVSPFNAKINLQNFRNWTLLGKKDNFPFMNITSVVAYQDLLFAAVSDDYIYYKNGGNWKRLGDSIILKNSTFLKVSNDKIIAGNVYQILYVNPDFTYYVPYRSVPYPIDALLDEKDHIWIAELNSGLLTKRFTQQYNPKLYIPNGPYTSTLWDLSSYGNNIIGVPGGATAGDYSSVIPAGYYMFDGTNWKNRIVRDSFPKDNSFAGEFDFVNSIYNPKNKSIYFASHQTGLVEQRIDGSLQRFDETNSPLSPLYTRHTYVYGMDVDKQGNLWVSNSYLTIDGAPCLFKLKPDGVWDSVKVVLNYEESKKLAQILIDDNDFKWLRPSPNRNQNIIVYNSTNGKSKLLTKEKGLGALPNSKVHCMAKDKNGQIWVGTEEGVAVFYEPSRIFFNGTDAGRPIVNNFPLLFDQIITCIKVDGGNRKWIGTRNGLWLFNDDGTEALLNFTIENSPIPSNYIRDVEINEITGEVFIGTDLGIVSYFGTATEGTKEFGEVKIYPNPVKSEFTGNIGITGLARDVSVKITDMFGNLVYETLSEGGMAIWNKRTYKGVAAKSGLYLVFASNKDGSASLVSKFSIIE